MGPSAAGFNLGTGEDGLLAIGPRSATIAMAPNLSEPPWAGGVAIVIDLLASWRSLSDDEIERR